MNELEYEFLEGTISKKSVYILFQNEEVYKFWPASKFSKDDAQERAFDVIRRDIKKHGLEFIMCGQYLISA